MNKLATFKLNVFLNNMLYFIINKVTYFIKYTLLGYDDHYL